ncbi:hypothetical protein MTQ24_03335 [Corynebacterium bovis]|uniref:hypothetical protein n=1 Tax=Corynebacterium bovis TaxID=36808 RepID=UPI00313A13A0
MTGTTSGSAGRTSPPAGGTSGGDRGRRTEILRCGTAARAVDVPGADPGADPAAPTTVTGVPDAFTGVVTVHDLPAVPGRRDLAFLGDLAAAALGEDDTPSLADLAARPDVPHLAEPVPAPQVPDTTVRVVVIGDDAACNAVVTKLMRIDALWIEVGYVPVGPGPSVIAATWGLDAPVGALLAEALTAPTTPTVLVRDDNGTVTLGAAEVFDGSSPTPGEMTGEAIVDSDTLFMNDATGSSRRPRRGAYGVRLVPMPGAPGIAAVRLTTPSRWAAGAGTDAGAGAAGSRAGLWSRLRDRLRPPAPPGEVDAEDVLTGRALQAGGVELAVVRDGVRHPRPVSSVTFYRHLRDLQVVRR